MEFVAGLNVIIGETDSGKSAILRALKWVLYNKPNGSGFRSSWGGETRVSIYIDDNVLIRGRGTSNYYQLNDTQLTAFGSNVPEVVQQVTRFADINFQSQMDAPFLLSMSSGQVAQFLNEIASLSIIDTKLNSINSMVRSNTQNTTYIQEQQTELRNAIATYAYIEQAEMFVNKLEFVEHEIAQKNKLITQLESVSQLFTRINTLRAAIIPARIFNQIQENIRKIQEVRLKSEALYALLTNIRNKQHELRTIAVDKQVARIITVCLRARTLYNEKRERLLDIKQLLAYKEQLKTMRNLRVNIARRRATLAQIKTLHNTTTKKIQLRTRIARAVVLIKRAETLIHKKEYILQLKTREFTTKFPKICPLCKK